MSISENATQVTSSAMIDTSIFSLIMSADMIGKLVFLVLMIASIWSWAIIFSKFATLKKINQKMRGFQKSFWQTKGMNQLIELSTKYPQNPLSNIFNAAVKECKEGNSKNNDMAKSSHKERIYCVMSLVKNQQLDQMESKLGFLATIGSSSPFIGLFGTVWGIMHSFQSIAHSKNATLAVVAPGIAEALLATAIGLFAAIPATIFYNYFTTRIDETSSYIDNFSGNLQLIFSKAIDQEEM
ncbi:MAG: hypothetical protein DGJ47_000020 [Rickettsiaceae bacterium]